MPYTVQELDAIRGTQSTSITRQEACTIVDADHGPRVYGVDSTGDFAGQIRRIPSRQWIRKYGYPEYLWATFDTTIHVRDLSKAGA